MTSCTKPEVKEQLARILASREFAESPRLGEFITYVVEQALEGRTGRIKQHEIAVQAMGYDIDFDASSNPTIRITAHRLRRALERYYANSGATDHVRIELPKGRYVPEFSKIPQPATSMSDRAALFPDLGLGVLERPGIAVLELEPLGHAERDSTIAVGLTSELLVALTRFAGISVLGPFSPNSNPPLQWDQARRDYGALFLLKGWIRTQENLVRITFELIETRAGQNRWAQSFDYDLKQIPLFTIEDEIASLVSGAVADDLGIVFRHLDTENYARHMRASDVTNAVLAYNKAWTMQSPQDWQIAHVEVGKALALDPENALLNALQANIHYADALHGLGIDPQSSRQMQALANKAIALDPTLQVAQYNMVVVNAFLGRADACVDAARKTVAMNPNYARILAGSAIAVTSVGAYDLGQGLIGRAKTLNPHYPGIYLFVDFVIHYYNERYGQAWECAQLIRTPGILWQPMIRAAALGMLGRAEDAKPYLEGLLQITPDFLERPLECVRALFVTDEHVDMIWDGLKRAGVEISQCR